MSSIGIRLDDESDPRVDLRPAQQTRCPTAMRYAEEMSMPGGYEKLPREARDKIAQELVRKDAKVQNQDCCQSCGLQRECCARKVRREDEGTARLSTRKCCSKCLAVACRFCSRGVCGGS